MQRWIPRRKLAGFLSLAVIPWFLGCGGHHAEEWTHWFDSLDADMRALNQRSISHYSNVTEIMLSYGDENNVSREFAAENLVVVVEDQGSQEKWAAIREEMAGYDQDMHGYLNGLAETLSMIGDCRMVMGDGHVGPVSDDLHTCSVRPYWGQVRDELGRHFVEMLSWTDQQAAWELMREMDIHRDQLGSHLRDMSAHMQDLYGYHGGMMNMW